MKKQLVISLALIVVCGAGMIGCKGEDSAAAAQPPAVLTPDNPNPTGTPTAGGKPAGGGGSNLATPGAPPLVNGSPP